MQRIIRTEKLMRNDRTAHGAGYPTFRGVSVSVCLEKRGTSERESTRESEGSPANTGGRGGRRTNAGVGSAKSASGDGWRGGARIRGRDDAGR